jgi:hypothetical protein
MYQGMIAVYTQLVMTYLSNPTLSNWWHIPHTGDKGSSLFITYLCGKDIQNWDLFLLLKMEQEQKHKPYLVSHYRLELKKVILVFNKLDTNFSCSSLLTND